MNITIKGQEFDLTDDELEALRLQLASETWVREAIRCVIKANAAGVMQEQAPAKTDNLLGRFADLAYELGRQIREANPQVDKRLKRLSTRG